MTPCSRYGAPLLSASSAQSDTGLVQHVHPQDLSEGERGKLQRAMGLKMEQLKVMPTQRVGAV